MDVEFSNCRGFIGLPGLSAARVACWEGVLAGLDRRLMRGRDAGKDIKDLDGPIRAVPGELGLLKRSSSQ